MIGLAGFAGLLALVLVVVELLRWTFRPEAKRLRALRKLRERR